ncbi:MAG: T9SS type A sorting domain-containing protein [Saprospiraceae bacterium]|nr:T9SS type A sorting domain-containing protein [Saprospiraceae bacterium]
MQQIIYIAILIFIGTSTLNSQRADWTIQLEPITIDGLPGAQSYAFGTVDGYWIIVGGRVDGLHQRQPFASFDPVDNNRDIILIHPKKAQFWTTSLEVLPQSLQEQLQSTNMQFHQNGNFLFVTGGYGYSETEDEHITYPYISRINLPLLKESILAKSDISSAFIQKDCNSCAVAGGRMEMINDAFYLVGGHYFYGRYNPHGPDHGPGFTQVYTGEARIIEIQNFEDDFNYSFNQAIHDELHLRKRDYNLVPQIRNGEELLVAFSGVFQQHVDLPYLYPVEIYQDRAIPIESFAQYLNHYHCANVPIYDRKNDLMNNLFFGGIAQFYFEEDILIQDNYVPFVKTVANVSYSESEGWIESKLALEMPDYFGAGSEFILADNVPVYGNGVIKLMELDQKHELGYIYGGIKSSRPNIFWINNGSQSEATPVIFKVVLTQSNSVPQSDMALDDSYLIVVPNPNKGSFKLIYNSDAFKEVTISIKDMRGTNVVKMNTQNVLKGKNFINIDLPGFNKGVYLIQLESEGKQILRKVIVDN